MSRERYRELSEEEIEDICDFWRKDLRGSSSERQKLFMNIYPQIVPTQKLTLEEVIFIPHELRNVYFHDNPEIKKEYNEKVYEIMSQISNIL